MKLVWRIFNVISKLAATTALLAGALIAGLLVLNFLDRDALSILPRKEYTGSQWVLQVLKRAARAYRDKKDRSPLDDAQSTSLHKPTGAGKREPYLEYHRDGIYVTCQLYDMTSPAHWPSAATRTCRERGRPPQDRGTF